MHFNFVSSVPGQPGENNGALYHQDVKIEETEYDTDCSVRVQLVWMKLLEGRFSTSLKKEILLF